MAGVPIRLVEKGENSVINLDCEGFFVQVNRAIPIMRIPILAQRAGLDANMVETSIRLDCVLRDDDCAAADLVSRAATSFIDFSTDANNTQDYMVGSSSQLVGTRDDYHNVQFTFVSTSGDTFTATFSTGQNGHTVDSSGKEVTIGIGNMSNPPKGSDMASRMKAVLETDSGQTTKFTDHISIAVSQGRKAPVISLTGEKNTKLVFTQVSAGLDGNNTGPTYNAGDNNTLIGPSGQNFTGGTMNNCRSAGDKAQDLLANVINTNFTGVSGGVGSPLSEGFENWEIDAISDDTGLVRGHDDYIIGLQIPYNSLKQASLGGVGEYVQGYASRNFLMMTGSVNTEEKGSAANVNPAGIAFDPKDKYTGIHGCLVGCDIKYDAGDTIYRATLTFMPIDIVVAL